MASSDAASSAPRARGRGGRAGARARARGCAPGSARPGATAVTRGPCRASRRSRWSSRSACDARTSKIASIREAVTLACCPPGPDDREARSSISSSGIVRSRGTWRPSLLVVGVVLLVGVVLVGVILGLRLGAVGVVVVIVIVGLVADVRPLGVGVGRPARDRVALVLVGVVDLLAVDLDAAVGVVAQARRAELASRALLVGVLALADRRRSSYLAWSSGQSSRSLGGSSSSSLTFSSPFS